METPNKEKEQKPRFAQVELGFLEALLEYLKRRPYEEVFQFVEVLTGRNLAPPPPPPPPPQPTTLQEIKPELPEGFNT